MTSGVLVPLDIELIEDAIARTPQLLRKRWEEVIDERAFAEAISIALPLRAGQWRRSPTRTRMPDLRDVGPP
jgi:hypothetical protein